MSKSNWMIAILVLAIVGLASKQTLDYDSFETTKNIEIFTKLYKELNTYYVDDLDPNKLMKTGVDAMLASLDPYTNYISENQIERYRFMTEGKYDGIGSKAEKIGDYVTIVEVFEGLSADQAGIRPGDKIVAVEGVTTKGKSLDEVNQMLRGVPGTEVTITVQKYSNDAREEVLLTRDEIQIPNVPYKGMVSDDVGYVALTTFTRNAGRNVSNAVKELKTNNPELKGVILDLRNNGGGLLMEAVSIVNIFIDAGKEVVTTKGKIKDWDREYKTKAPALDSELPVIVLTNNRSASASEIVSGVLQDYDRAVIMGQRTFGKGLVQNTRDLGYNSRIKMTTAKYYIPSGRCIQSVEYDEGEPVDIADSLRAVFYTENGRPVLDGGGVSPDVKLKRNSKSTFFKALEKEHILFNFVNRYEQTHDSIGSIESFSFDQYDEFIRFAEQSGFSYQTSSERELSQLRAKVESEGLSGSLDDELSEIMQVIESTKEDDFEEFKAEVRSALEKEIASRYYYQKGKVRQQLKNDVEVKAAIELLRDSERYNKILSGEAK